MLKSCVIVYISPLLNTMTNCFEQSKKVTILAKNVLHTIKKR